MNNILASFLNSTIAGFSTIIGYLTIFIKVKASQINKFICFCLSFSLGIMICISIFDLIPACFLNINNTFGIVKTILLLIISFIISFLVIKYVDKIASNQEQINDLYKLGILNMIILIFHNLPEGVATFLSSYQSKNLGIKISIAIMLHNIPEGISIAVPIFYATKNKFKAFKATLISAFAEPLGALLAFLFLKKYVNELMISIILLVVAGLMITLSIEEMLPKVLKYNEKKYMVIGLLSSILMTIINLLLF